MDIHPASSRPSRGRRTIWTRETAQAELKRFARLLGHAPSTTEVRSDDRCRISLSQIYRLFETLPKAHMAAGLVYQRPDTSIYNDEQLMLERLRFLHAQNLTAAITANNGQVDEHTAALAAPTPANYRDHFGGAGYNFYAKRWGSFQAALIAAKIPVLTLAVTPDRIARAIHSCRASLPQLATGQAPTASQYRAWQKMPEHAAWPTLHQINSLYESWNSAMRAVGLSPARASSPSSGRRRSRSACDISLNACQAHLGTTPTSQEYRAWADSHPMVPNLADVVSIYGSWNSAVTAAGLKSRRRDWDETELLDWLRTWRRENDQRRPKRAEWDSWVQSQVRSAPQSATIARLLGDGSWRMALRRAGWT